MGKEFNYGTLRSSAPKAPHPLWKKIGMGVVAVDTITNGMLSYTLINELLQDSLGEFTVIPAALIGIGTYIAVYSLLSPYVGNSVQNLPGNVAYYAQKVKSCDFSLSDMAHAPFYMLNVLLTINAAYIFTGMKMEGVDSWSDMFNAISSDHPEALQKMVSFCQALFSSPYFKWALVSFNIPVTLLAYIAVHKHFIIDTPKKAWGTLQKTFFESVDIQQFRQSYAYSLGEYIKILPNISTESIDLIYERLASTETNAAKIHALHIFPGFTLAVPPKRSPTHLVKQFFARAVALGVFFMGTFCMQGNAKMASKKFDMEMMSEDLLFTMSLGTRVSITAIWFENAYGVIGDMYQALTTRSLGIRLDNNLQRFMYFALAGLSGAASAISLVHSVLFSLDMERMDYVSALGLIYIATAAFGCAVADGAPVFKARLASNKENYAKKDDRYKLYVVNQTLGNLATEVTRAEKQVIESLLSSDTAVGVNAEGFGEAERLLKTASASQKGFGVA